METGKRTGGGMSARKSSLYPKNFLARFIYYSLTATETSVPGDMMDGVPTHSMDSKAPATSLPSSANALAVDTIGIQTTRAILSRPVFLKLQWLMTMDIYIRTKYFVTLDGSDSVGSTGR